MSKIELHITGESPQDLEVIFSPWPECAQAVEEWAVAFLRKRKVVVDKFGQAETPSQFQERTGVSAMTFGRRVKDPQLQHLFKATWGPSRGRMLAIRSSPEFDAVCRINLKKEKRK